MLEAKKIKEIKNIAKGEVKYFMRRIRQNEEAEKAGFPARKKEFNQKYPKGITSWYEQILEDNKKQEPRLLKQFGYTPETLEERAEVYHEAFWSSWRWWEVKIVEDEAVMVKYKKIFDEAEAIAKEVDVSDIQDGFPCGSALVYLKPEAKDTDLGKALRRQFDGDSYSAKVCHWSAYQLPIKIPNYGQCMSFDERICEKVAEFLNSKNIPTGVYSMID